MNCSILVRRALLLAKLPRRRSFRARMENQISIWLSHDACLGVKWKVTRCCGSRRNASRVALHASTPDFPLTPSLSLRPETRATRRTTDHSPLNSPALLNGGVFGVSKNVVADTVWRHQQELRSTSHHPQADAALR